ncbi:MAG TPA: hypothetical protein VJZ70_02925 [Limnochordia bacterium]|nr:hypothetical protein [Limnochordia bacterium]
MRKHLTFLVAFLLMLGLQSTVWAMDFDFDDLFGDDLFAVFEEEGEDLRPEEALLVQDGWEVGGNYRFSVTTRRTYIKDVDVKPMDNLGASLGGQIYVDARPDPDFRVFGKAGLSYAVNKQIGQEGQVSDPLKISLQELFSDFNYDNKVFFRAGKQNVRWGVGYFFSPADVISIGRIDPLDPDLELEGPVALKVHYPRGSTNYYLFTLFDGVNALNQVALAPKLEFVLGGTEIGLGGFYQKDKAPRAMLTVSSSLGNLAVFGEAVVSKGSDKGFAEAGLSMMHPPTYPVSEKDQLFFHATAGARYSHSDPDGLFNLTVAGQYYYNGEGYKEQEHIQAFRVYYAGLLALTQSDDEMMKTVAKEALAKINPSDMNSTGRHYLGAMVGWSNLLNTKLSASAFLNANLSDQSGMVTTTLSLPSLSKISPSVGVMFNYGDVATEFGALGRNTTVFAAVTLGSGAF